MKAYEIMIEMSSTVNTWIDTLQSFESLLISQCYRHITRENILHAWLTSKTRISLWRDKRQGLLGEWQ